MYNIIKTRYIWLTISGVLVIASIILLLVWGLKPGIDFTGGSLVQLKFPDQVPANQEIVNQLAEYDLGSIKIQTTGEQNVILRLKHLDHDTHMQILSTLQSQYEGLTEESFETVGPTIGQELREKANTAIVAVIICIVLYIAIAFRKISTGSIKSWTFGVSAIIALAHDILITVSVFVILGRYLNVEVDALFVTALLAILGFSVNDTIVVFDRIRERLARDRGDDFKVIINKSINQTITRSINTTVTTLFVLLALYFFGGESIRWFVLALSIGIVAGTYSSIFIASPLLLVWEKILKR